MKRALEIIEKNQLLAWLMVVMIGVLIIYMSSLPAPRVVKHTPSYMPVIYHMTIFFFFNFLLLIAFKSKDNFKKISLVVFISILYSITDEVHQIFVPGRSSSFEDLMLDSIGIFSSTILYYLIRNKN